MSDRIDALDRRAAVAMAILAMVVALINVDRFVLGKAGPLRAHDLADGTVTITAAGGEIWRSGLRSTWDGSQLRGFPRAASAQHPQTLWSLTGAAVATERVLPVLLTALQVVMTAGAFLFVRCFLRRSHDAAIAGAILYLTLFYFFHEHPVVTSALLLPSLGGFLSIPVTAPGWRALQIGGAALVMMLSNPTSTLFAMPAGHLAMIVLLRPRAEWRGHIAAFAAFWLAYAIYYAPTLAAQLRAFPESSRSLYRPPAGVLSYGQTLREMLLNPSVISPALVFVALVDRRTWRKTLLFLALVVAAVALAAANQMLVGSESARRFPLLLAISTLYYRMYYFVPVAVLVWATWIWQDGDRPRPAALLRRAVIVSAFCAFVAWPLSTTDWVTGPVLAPYWRYALVLGAAMAFGIAWWTRRAWSVAIVAAAVLLFARAEYTRTWEVPFQGNLFLEAPYLGLPAPTGRSVTVMTTCDAVNLFPAQARAAGFDTLDGIANLYDRGFAERWRHFVADNPATCTARYSTWPTRVELTVADLQYAADRILPWLWINGVSFVRAPVPLDYPELELVDRRTFTYDKVQTVTRYLYRMRSPVGRVFTLPDALARRASSGDLGTEESALSDLVQHGGVSSVESAAADASHLRFSGAFEPGRLVVASINYHRDWRLRIDGADTGVPIVAGPFGMLAFDPPDGHHAYELAFVQRTTALIPICMLASLGLLFGLLHPSVSRRLAGARPAGLGRRRAWLGLAAAVAIAVLAAVVVIRGNASPSAAAWVQGPWPYRMALRTAGAAQTAPVPNFPLRIEFTRRDAAFWKAVHPDGRDLRVTGADGHTLLPFEIEEIDARALRLIMWVRIPELPTGPATVAYLYFGNRDAALAENAPAVWDAQYAGVWHMNPRRGSAEGRAADSTVHGRAALLHDVAVDSPDGDAGMAFDGERTRLEIPAWPAFASSSGDWTVEFRIRPAQKAGRNFGILRHGSAGAFHLYLHNGGYLVLERKNGAAVTETGFSASHLEDAAWTAVTLTRTRGHLRLALDGVARDAIAVRPPFADGGADAPLDIGLGPHGRLEGRLEELRLSLGIARSADWIHASAGARAASFVTHGAVETR